MENDDEKREEKRCDEMGRAERKKKKREHEQPLAMNLDKEKRLTRELKSLFCLSLFDGKRKLDEYENNIQCFQGDNIDLLVHKSLFSNPRVYLG